MDGDVLKERVIEAIKQIPPFYYIPAAIFVCGLIFLGIGMTQLLTPKPTNSLNTIDSSLKTQNSQKTNLIEVDVEGAVIKPGVYSLPQNSRLKDALVAAGGMSSSADRDAIAKNLNLAVKVIDGAKVYIPKIGDTPINSQASSTDNSTQVLGTTTGLINVNTASPEQLDSLPGVGQVTAQKIIDNRPYNSVDDLLSKKAVGNSVFEKIKDKITVY
ncbi:MAG TPA: ComEA family DNA-binding protein [Patescibacteria group bacterium]